MKIEIPYMEDKELQQRFENWLLKRGNEFAKPKSIHATSFIVVPKDEQDAFWIGCNYVSLVNKLFDGPITRTLSG